jgi:very-short-patch-repair endonuclease
MQQFEFNGSVITTRISEDGRLYFRANDVVTALGYKSKQKPILSFVSPEYVTTFGEMRANQFDKFERLHTKYIQKEGVEQLLIKGRAVRNVNITQYLIDTFQLDVKQFCESKEQKYIAQLMSAFRHEKYERQFCVGKFRIDLYFYEKKIAVECDELGHADRDQLYEKARESYLRERLGCKLVRFNPDETNFDPFQVVNEIISLMYA